MILYPFEGYHPFLHPPPMHCVRHSLLSPLPSTTVNVCESAPSSCWSPYRRHRLQVPQCIRLSLSCLCCSALVHTHE